MEEKSIESLAEELGRAAREHGARIATAESCTAGGISYAITSVPAAWFLKMWLPRWRRARLTALTRPIP